MDLIIAALATWQIVEIWHHSSLMAPLRARTEMWTGKIGQLLGCPWCLSVWVGMLCGVLLASEDAFWLSRVGSVFVYGFAISRLANLGNDIFKGYCRTPRIQFEDWEETNSIG